MEKKRLEFTGTGLKLIAVITMFIDHIGAGIFEKSEAAQLAIENFWPWNYNSFDNIFRAIGRMAFPIYCFMLVEGFFHTKSRLKYAQRLLFIAVISEVPFDMLFRLSYFDFRYNNVLWELLLGLGVLCGLDYANNKDFSFTEKRWANDGLMVIVMLIGMGIGYLTHLDYSMSGICCISVMYKYYGTTKKDRLKSFGMGQLMLSLFNFFELPAFLMLLPMSRYEGHRGRDSKAMRTFFYFFYPAHIVVLYVIRTLLFG